jgi:hypothetical protein
MGLVPEWEEVTDLGFVEYFVGFGWGRSSILGIAGLQAECVTVGSLIDVQLVTKEFQFGT